MLQRIEFIRENLAAGRDYLNAVLDNVGHRWETQVYSDGAQWNVRQIVVHLADADEKQNQQIIRYAQDEQVIPPDFDVDRYNLRQTEKRAHVTVEEALASLERSRAELLAWLDRLEDEAVLEKQGRRASLEVVPLWRFLVIMALHERSHAEDIASALHIVL